MRDCHESWRSYQFQLKEDYAASIMSATQPLIETYNSYEKQHDAFVAHAKSTIVVLKAQIKTIEELIESAEKQKLLQLERKPEPAITEDWEPEEKRSNESGAGREKPRSSRWDAAGDPSVPGTLPPPAPPGIWNEGPTFFRPQDDHPAAFVQPHALPDLSRPPPGFAGPPPGMIMAFDEKQLIPTLAYYDLPAGLMVPLIPLDEFGYKPIDPKQIRLRCSLPLSSSMRHRLMKGREILTVGKCLVFTNGRRTKLRPSRQRPMQLSQVDENEVQRLHPILTLAEVLLRSHR